MSEELKAILSEFMEETGWLTEREQAVIAETARATAKKLLEFGDPIEKIAAVTNLPIEEVMELA